MRWPNKLALGCLLAACVASDGHAQRSSCVSKRCKDMLHCAEAHHHFAVCGERVRDGDNDGIPCENVCGQTLEEYARRRAATGGAATEDATPEDAGSELPPSQ